MALSNMEAPGLDGILQVLKENYDGEILHAEMSYDFPVVVLKKEKIIEIIRCLYDHPSAKFQFLTTLCGIHYPELNQIAVMYQLHNLVTNQRVRLKIYLPGENPVVPTLTNIFPAANWMERETYDFFGVIFEGHPGLTRILNVDEMSIFPLRKEYPLEDQVRTDKNDAMFGR